MKMIKLSHDRTIANESKMSYIHNCENLNKLLGYLEADVFKQVLSEVELESLMENPKKFVTDTKTSIAIEFPFKNADADFNLKAMGVSYERVNAQIHLVSNKPYKYEIKNGEFHQLEEEIQKAIDEGDIYTKSKEQVKIYKELVKVCDIVNKNDLLSTVMGGQGMALKLFKRSLTVVEGKLLINPTGILSI